MEIIDKYRRAETSREGRRALLRALAAEASPEALATLAEVVANPGDAGAMRAEDALVALGPLLTARRTYDASSLFPRLLDAIEFPAVAAIALDLANHVTRRKLVERHPATMMSARMETLFAGTVDGLLKIQEQRSQSKTKAPREKDRRVFDQSCSLLIALADTLGLIGERSAAATLRRGLALAHRRLVTEIGAALARLGQEDGVETLVRMTEHSVVRNRAAAYLQELGLAERIPPDYASAESRAEGELAAWLSEPLHFGLPPHEMELVDRRTQYWPGYEQPVECFLFRYTYRTQTGEFSGVGIVGPVTHSFMVDFDDWPPADIYAAYAGWQAEHDEIVERAVENLSPQARLAATERCAALATQGYDDARPVKVGGFFGEEQLVATARRGGDPGVVVVAGGRASWYRSGNRRASRAAIGPTEAYFIHKGRELLRTFNRRGED
jgi:hypothetical protein